MAAATYSPCRQPCDRSRLFAGRRAGRADLDTPLWLADNDRLVLRDISARATLAGARVVTLKAPRRGKRKPDYLHWLSTLAAAQDDSAALAIHLERAPSTCRISVGRVSLILSVCVSLLSNMVLSKPETIC